MTEKLVIIGSGPAGLTAAIYAARASLSPLVIEGFDAGGQLMITTDVDNFPGFPDGIKGPELMDRMRKQAERFGVRFISGNVSSVELKGDIKRIIAGKNTYEAHAVIISTGAQARWLDIPSETALRGKGVSACATCDGFFFKNLDVVVIGGGDTAVEEALYLAGLVRSVAVIHRRDELRASKAMQERAQKNPKIRFIWDSVVEEILDVAAGKVTGLKVKNVKDGKISTVACDGVFIAIGHTPNTTVFKDVITLDEKGYIKTQKGTTLTNIEGVFACGDVADSQYRQAVTAAGTGCMSALEAERHLGAKGLV